MTRYSKQVTNETKAVKARGTHLRVHYKHCREIANAIKGLVVGRAKAYLTNVLAYKEAIPFTKYTGGIGRHAVGKQSKAPGDKVAWPQKATKTFLDLLTNIESNAGPKNLDLDKVRITHANVNQAPKMRRRTYRAHGRINAYMSCPAHIQLIGEELSDEIAKEEEKEEKTLTKKQTAQKAASAKRAPKRVAVGGGGGM